MNKQEYLEELFFQNKWCTMEGCFDSYELLPVYKEKKGCSVRVGEIKEVCKISGMNKEDFYKIEDFEDSKENLIRPIGKDIYELRKNLEKANNLMGTTIMENSCGDFERRLSFSMGEEQSICIELRLFEYVHLCGFHLYIRNNNLIDLGVSEIASEYE